MRRGETQQAQKDEATREDRLHVSVVGRGRMEKGGFVCYELQFFMVPTQPLFIPIRYRCVILSSTGFALVPLGAVPQSIPREWILSAPKEVAIRTVERLLPLGEQSSSQYSRACRRLTTECLQRPGCTINSQFDRRSGDIYQCVIQNRVSTD